MHWKSVVGIPNVSQVCDDTRVRRDLDVFLWGNSPCTLGLWALANQRLADGGENRATTTVRGGIDLRDQRFRPRFI